MQMHWLWSLALIGAASAHAAVTEIAPDTWLVPGATPADAQPDGNSVIIRSNDGLIVFDTGRHAAHTQQIVDFAKERNLPVTAIINSHWHLDHTGGNGMLRSRFANVRVYASTAYEGALTGFLARYRGQLEQAIAGSGDAARNDSMRAEIGLIDSRWAMEPTYVVGTTGRRTIVGRDLELHLEERAVTAADIWVLDPQTRVLLAGDLVTLPAPFLDTACPKRWRSALVHLETTRFVTLVPGHGAPMDHEGLKTYRKAFNALLDCAASDAAKESCVDGWLRDASSLLPDEADREYARGALGYYMDQTLRGHDDQLKELCAR
jgi:glyoxylase-like metal-dependent hydrolase (beta-lactamase superfamily II)